MVLCPWAKLSTVNSHGLQVGRLLAGAGDSREGEGAGVGPTEGEKRLARQGSPTNSPGAHRERGFQRIQVEPCGARGPEAAAPRTGQATPKAPVLPVKASGFDP